MTLTLTSGKTITVSAKPYDYCFVAASTALIVIDMQRDFIEAGGFGEALGNDVSQLSAAVPVTAALLKLARELGMTVVHTREAHLSDLSDCPPSKLTRGNPSCRIGDPGPMGRILIRGEPGNDFVPALQPLPGEIIIDKPGKGAFYGTPLQERLQQLGITHLLFAGVTTEVCVQTSMREANDRGYECLLIEDATASYFPHFKQATLAMMHAQGGIVGWTASLSALSAAINPKKNESNNAEEQHESPCEEISALQLNLPDVLVDLNSAFEQYEHALVQHDVATLDQFFWFNAQTVRYGIAENLYGGEAIRTYRLACAPVPPGRRIVRKVSTSFGHDFGTVSIEFSSSDAQNVGRQMQTWVRFPEGWRIVAAHVSLM